MKKNTREAISLNTQEEMMSLPFSIICSLETTFPSPAYTLIFSFIFSFNFLSYAPLSDILEYEAESNKVIYLCIEIFIANVSFHI